VPVKTREKKMVFFLWGQTSDFHASCGKISMDDFQKENNVIAHIREILQLYENITLSK